MEKLEIENCTHCGATVEVMHDVEANGFKIKCPHCGKDLLLCGACLNYGEKSCISCDWSPSTGCNKEKEKRK